MMLLFTIQSTEVNNLESWVPFIPTVCAVTFFEVVVFGNGLPWLHSILFAVTLIIRSYC